MRYVGHWLGILVIFTLANPCRGTEIAYSFSGTVSGSGSPFGHFIPSGSTSTFTGHFAYDTDSVGVLMPGPPHPVALYQQHRSEGFVVTFGSTKFSADDYFVGVQNNLDPPPVGGTLFDDFDIRFQGGQLPSSLRINDIPQALGNGLLHVALRYGSTTWTNTSLPSAGSLSGTLVLKLSLLNDNPDGVGSPDVLFRVTSIAATTLPPEVNAAVPEPASGILTLVALAVTFGYLRLSRRHRKL